MTLLANVLQGDRTDLDLIQLALETLANLITCEPGNDEGNRVVDVSHPMMLSFDDTVACLEQANLPPDITVQFTGTNRGHASLVDR